MIITNYWLWFCNKYIQPFSSWLYLCCPKSQCVNTGVLSIFVPLFSRLESWKTLYLTKYQVCQKLKCVIIGWNIIMYMLRKKASCSSMFLICRKCSIVKKVRGNIQTLVEVSIFGFVFFQMKMDTYQNMLVWLGSKPANERESLNMQRQAGIFQRLICYSLRSHWNCDSW